MYETFILQLDENVCLVERRVALQGMDGASVLRASLSVVEGLSPSPGAHHARICPVGSVEFCRAWMRAAGVPEPEPVDYPVALRRALARSVAQVPFSDVAFGAWVKPVRTKAWDPHVKWSAAAHAPDERVWTSPVIPKSEWLAEWRVYVVEGQIVGAGRYDDRQDDSLAFDGALVQSWVDAYTASGQAPAGYALDVALWANRQTVLVEVTDGWAIGYYRGTCAPRDYVRLLRARWDQMARARVAPTPNIDRLDAQRQSLQADCERRCAQRDSRPVPPTDDDWQADERAHRIASQAAEELIRTEGIASAVDAYVFDDLAALHADAHLLECIDHLLWHGQAAYAEAEGGAVVQLGDFPRSTR